MSKFTPSTLQSELPFTKPCECGCGEPAPLAKQTHLARGIVKGQPLPRIRSHYGRRNPEQRFWEKVDKNGPIHPVLKTHCWLWLGQQNGKGYGRLSVGSDIDHSRRHMSAHRLSWELHFGPIPDDLWVLHKCDNPPCCNPEHFFLGTNTDNSADKMSKGRGNQGVRHGHAKFTDLDIREIRQRCAEGELQRSLAREKGVGETTIFNIVNRKTWKHVE